MVIASVRLQWTDAMRAELVSEAAKLRGSDSQKARALSVLLSRRWGVSLTYDAARYTLGEARRRAKISEEANAGSGRFMAGAANFANLDQTVSGGLGQEKNPSQPDSLVKDRPESFFTPAVDTLTAGVVAATSSEARAGAPGPARAPADTSASGSAKEARSGHGRQNDDAPIFEHPPSVQTSKSRGESYLIISDTQLPYHHPGALAFCQRVRTEFGVRREHVIHVGDEFDFYFASRFDKSPEAPHSPKQEIEAGREEVARWVAAFPELRICYSNHGGRLRASAHRSNLPVSLIRNVREIYGLPEGWRYAAHWIIQASKRPFRVEHGHVGPGGHSGLRGRPLNRMMSTAWGHEHAEAATIHVDTHGGGQLWGMRVGSLISKEPLPAFEYNAEQGSRPVGSVGVVLDGGRLPLIVRM